MQWMLSSDRFEWRCPVIQYVVRCDSGSENFLGKPLPWPQQVTASLADEMFFSKFKHI